MRDLTHITADTDLTALSDRDAWSGYFNALHGYEYPDESTPEQIRLGDLFDALNDETTRRVGDDGVERLADWVTGNHASIADCIQWAETGIESLLAVTRGELTR